MMNKNFGEWYRISNLTPEHIILQMRWDAISAFLKQDITSIDIINLVRMFYGLEVPSDFGNKLSSFFVEKDNAFDTRNKKELSVLAGALLRQMCEEDDIDSLIYLLVTSAAFCNKSPSVPAIQEEILDLFNNACVNTREELYYYERTKINLPSVKSINETFKEEDVNWDDDTAKILNTAFTSINKTLSSLIKVTNQYDRYTRVCAEDSQILWWLVGKWSNDFQKPFSNFTKQEAPIYIGKELADLVSILPGPYSAMAVLGQVLGECQKGEDDIVISDAINSLSPEWKQNILGGFNLNLLEEITPLLYAISLSLKVDNKEGWYPLFKKATSLQPNEIKCNTLEIAYQVYIECLSIKALEETAYE